MKTINIELSEPIKYTGEKGELEANFIEVDAPNGEIAHLIGILKSEIGQATRKSLEGLDFGEQEQADDGDSESSPEEIGSSAFSMLTMGGADMEKVIVTFKEVFRHSARAGGEKTMTLPMINRMSYPDIEKSLKMYIGNFMKAS